MKWLQRIKTRIAEAMAPRIEPVDVWEPTEQETKRYAPDEDLR